MSAGRARAPFITGSVEWSGIRAPFVTEEWSGIRDAGTPFFPFEPEGYECSYCQAYNSGFDSFCDNCDEHNDPVSSWFGGVPVLVGDGIADDTAALQAFVNKEPVVFDGKLYPGGDGCSRHLYGGEFRLSDWITIPPEMGRVTSAMPAPMPPILKVSFSTCTFTKVTT